MAGENLLPVHRFSALIKGSHVEFQVIQLEQSFFLWIGSGKPELSDLSVALQNSYQKTPIATAVLSRNETDSYSSTLSQRLAKKTGKQVFVSYNINSEDPGLHQDILGRVFEEIATSPEAF